MAEALTKKTLFSQSRQNFVDVIKEHVDDPVTTPTESRKFIYARKPDSTANDFSGYPLIVVYGSTVDTPSDNNANLHGTSGYIDFGLEVEVRTTDRKYNNSEGKGLQHNDQIFDDLLATLNDQSVRNDLRENNIYNVDISTTGISDDPEDNQLIYVRTMIVSFETRITYG